MGVFKSIKVLAAVAIAVTTASAQDFSISWYTANPNAEVFNISNEAQLRGFARLVNENVTISIPNLAEPETFKDTTYWRTNFSGRTIVLTNNIDLGNRPWIPVGKDSRSDFRGTFDGGNNEIRQVFINSEADNQGFFGELGYGGVIKNLGLVNVNITGDSFVGGLIGSGSRGTIVNSFVSGSVVGSVSSVGGLVGSIDEITIMDSYAEGSVVGNDYAGGLVGYSRTVIIENSHATGNVESNRFVGGLAGGLGGMGGTATIINSYATGDVNGNSSIGGLVGFLDRVGTIINSYATGNVEGNSHSVGGLAGNNCGTIINSYATGNVKGNDGVGGLVGVNSGTIINSYITGNVEGNDGVGGLVGRNDGVIGNNSYYNKDKNDFDNGLGIGKTTAEMQSVEFANTLILWADILQNNLYRGNADDIEINRWIYSAGNYPRLSNEVSNGRSINSYFASGNGTEANPYRISTKKQLEDFAWLVNGGLSFEERYVQLQNDIVFNDTTDWGTWNNNTPDLHEWVSIGGLPHPTFNGTFDGNYNVISGIYMNTGLMDGLFGRLEGTVKNLGLVAFRSRASGLVGTNRGRITNCYAAGSVSSGVLVRNNWFGEIINSYVKSGRLTESNTSGTIINCYAIDDRENASAHLIPIDSRITSSYYYSETSETNSNKRTSGEMKRIKTYANWDFRNVWGMSAAINGGYPYLRGFRYEKYQGDIDVTEKISDDFYQALLDIIGGEDGDPIFYADISEITELDLSVPQTEGSIMPSPSARPLLSNLNGIEFFTSLERLNVSGNKIEELDLSQNIMLVELDLRGNSLTELDVSGLSGLAVLDVRENYMLSEDDVTGLDPTITTDFRFEPQKERGIDSFCLACGNRHSACICHLICGDCGKYPCVCPLKLPYVNDISSQDKIKDWTLSGSVSWNASNGGSLLLNASGASVTLPEISADNTGMLVTISAIWGDYILLHTSFDGETYTDQGVFPGGGGTKSIPDGTKYIRFVSTSWGISLVSVSITANCDDCGKNPCECPVCDDCGKKVCVCPICEHCGKKNCTDGCGKTSIFNLTESNSRYGIKFAKNIVSNKAEISVVLPNNERVANANVVIYDMTGNVVFVGAGSARPIVWDLRNTAGRFVANGTYLIIAEAKDRNGRTYQYSARLGVKR